MLSPTPNPRAPSSLSASTPSRARHTRRLPPSFLINPPGCGGDADGGCGGPHRRPGRGRGCCAAPPPPRARCRGGGGGPASPARARARAAPPPPHAAAAVGGHPVPAAAPPHGGRAAAPAAAVRQALRAAGLGHPAAAAVGWIRREWGRGQPDDLGGRPPVLDGRELPPQLLRPQRRGSFFLSPGACSSDPALSVSDLSNPVRFVPCPSLDSFMLCSYRRGVVILCKLLFGEDKAMHFVVSLSR
jgi:hypothetical protein